MVGSAFPTKSGTCKKQGVLYYENTPLKLRKIVFRGETAKSMVPARQIDILIRAGNEEPV